MPPSRTMPPAKAVKTERTHEENQERAYIAASRRSDRSLEARVESARRASEIHKKRTGRSLKVTEQDVMNEEMYEEEDDDMPAHYRRLTAHLNGQTGSADFNRKLAAYLCTNVAMRTAVEHAISNSYQQNAGAGMMPGAGLPFTPNPMYATSPMLALQHQQQRAQIMLQQQQQLQNPMGYRQAPYAPRPLLQHQQQQMMQQQMNNKSQMAQGQETKEVKKEDEANQQQGGMHRPPPISTNSALSVSSLSLRSPANSSGPDRRQSVPTVATGMMSPVDTREPMSATTETFKQRPSFPPGSFSQVNLTQHNHITLGDSSVNTNFATPQPAEPQMLLNSAVNPFCNDPLLNNWSGMVGNNTFANNSAIGGDIYNNYYNYGASTNSTGFGKQQVQPTFDGLNSTLAPAASDRNNIEYTQSFLDRPVDSESPERKPNEAPENNWANDFFDYENWDSNAPSASQ